MHLLFSLRKKIKLFGKTCSKPESVIFALSVQTLLQICRVNPVCNLMVYYRLYFHFFQYCRRKFFRAIAEYFILSHRIPNIEPDQKCVIK